MLCGLNFGSGYTELDIHQAFPPLRDSVPAGADADQAKSKKISDAAGTSVPFVFSEKGGERNSAKIRGSMNYRIHFHG